MRRRLLPNLLIALIVIILAGGAYTFLKDMDGPTVTISPKTDRISPMTQLTLSLHDALPIYGRQIRHQGTGARHPQG